MQTEVVRACKSRFDEQLSRVYTRAVYNEYKREYINNTAFVIEPDPGVECGYLVKHEKGDGTFCWAQHAFKVVADKAAGVYKCECMQWEHTGEMNCNLITLKKLNIDVPAYLHANCNKKCRSVLHAHNKGIHPPPSPKHT
jgi:hypothetical protein